MASPTSSIDTRQPKIQLNEVGLHELSAGDTVEFSTVGQNVFGIDRTIYPVRNLRTYGLTTLTASDLG